MTYKLLLAAIVAAFAVQAAAIASDDATKDAAKSMAIAVDQSGIAAQPARDRVKPHNHNEFHKQGAPAAGALPVVAGAARPLHDHGKMHKQQ